jgi:hypothetical protein
VAATGILAEARSAIVAQLTTLGLAAVTDPRNIRPRSVLVEAPTFTSFTYNVGDLRFTLRIVAAPPGNQDAEDYLITTADRIMNSPIAVTDGRPTLTDIGGQTLPSYDLTVAVAVKRN